MTYVKLAGVGVDPKSNLTKARAILQRLGKQGVLTAKQQGWISIVDAQLAALDASARPR